MECHRGSKTTDYDHGNVGIRRTAPRNIACCKSSFIRSIRDKPMKISVCK